MTWPLVRRDRWRTTVRVLAVLALLAPLVLPLVLLVLGALDTPGQSPPQTARDLLPDQPGRAGLDAALAMTPLWRQLANTALVTAVAVPVTVLLASSAGFAIGAGRGLSARWLLWVTVLLALVPPLCLWVPRVVLLRWLGLGGETLTVTFTALAATSPLLVLLYALAYRRVPTSTLDAARSESLGPVATWWRVAMPQVPGATFAVAALAFAAHWGNVMEPTLLLTDPERKTAALGVRTLAGLEPTLYPVFLSAALVVTIPPLLVFLLAQRRIFALTTSEER